MRWNAFYFNGNIVMASNYRVLLLREQDFRPTNAVLGHLYLAGTFHSQVDMYTSWTTPYMQVNMIT